MTFEYRSIRVDDERELPADVVALPADVVAGIRAHLVKSGLSEGWDLDQLQDCLWGYRHRGQRLLINQLEPIFIYLARYGKLWPE